MTSSPSSTGGVEAVEEADVLAADVDVDEAAQVAVLGDPVAQLVVAVVEAVEHLADGRRRRRVASASPPVAARSCVGILTVTAIRRATPRRRDSAASNDVERRLDLVRPRTCRAPRRASSGPRR